MNNEGWKTLKAQKNSFPFMAEVCIHLEGFLTLHNFIKHNAGIFLWIYQIKGVSYAFFVTQESRLEMV